MVELNKDNLEEAITKGNKETPERIQPPIQKEMEIGFHQGTLTTLLNERNELINMIKNVEGIMQAHIKRLEELGVKIQINSAKNEKKE